MQMSVLADFELYENSADTEVVRYLGRVDAAASFLIFATCVL